MSDSEENSSMFDVSADLVAPAYIKPAGLSEVTFDGLLATPLKLHEDLKNGCGGQLWPAGMVLSKYILRSHRNDLVDKTIVELGAGVHITDQIPMFDLMKKNIALNNLSSKAVASVYDWGTPVPASVPSHPDIILAADCVYFEPAFPLLQQTLKDLIGENTVCYFCFKRRRRADLQFMKVAKKMFDVSEVDDDVDKEIYSREKLFLYRITKKRN
ncbi:hypothetical protein BU24DRAFT_487876 [Aaosphaeria arxii CBS 175.79]|uniref:Protein-lysine N-methyltransferase EFM6 n=1 Tax=Aaosphaeria arxii CBS 175.79 TaxID=1450172 RepID=A0A6A5Y9N1_9PLEO|nr:uncharacterized protein BU24DRAFT_487876 [Aaosphaeria arxii CBS 175.79]KAF2021461.1 hypothetical protein BU24DRAFT_487876 [Aaosphaeria arxii CBS 175.79]